MDDKKKLTLSNRSRMIGGVCGGLAEYFSLDPTIVRVGFAVLTVASLGLGGVLVYIIVWAITPRLSD